MEMARYAGAEVFAGLEDMEAAKNADPVKALVALLGPVAAAGMVLPVETARGLLGNTQKLFMEGMLAIFESMGSMVVAYSYGGISSVNYWVNNGYQNSKNLPKNEVSELLSAWKLVDSKNEDDQWAGALALTYHEQGQYVVQPVFDKIVSSFGPVAPIGKYLIGRFAKCPTNSGGCQDWSEYTDEFQVTCSWTDPLFCSTRAISYTDYNDRMDWIANNVVPGVRAYEKRVVPWYSDMLMPVEKLAKRYRQP